MPNSFKTSSALDDSQTFLQLLEPLRATLMAHCYRMMGSLEEAEDLVQETSMRAWRAKASFAGRASFRTWLLKIATNACLDALDKRNRRSLPTWVLPPADAGTPFMPGVDETPWLGPFPDRLVATIAPDPEAQYTQFESIRLAFMVALHYLPPRQRAVLLLRDVLGFRAKEVAAQLDMTVAAVNSALQRARTTLQDKYSAQESIDEKNKQNDDTMGLLNRYMEAWEAADVNALLQLLTEDAAFSMPPAVIWYQGHAAIHGFLITVPFERNSEHRWQLRITQANMQPALGLYQFDPETTTYKAAALQTLAIRDGLINDVITFLNETHFTYFGLPMVLSYPQIDTDRHRFLSEF